MQSSTARESKLKLCTTNQKIINLCTNKYLTAFVAGALLPLAFAPYRFWYVAILSLIILIAIWNRASPKQAFLSGWLFGIGCFGFGITWFISCVTDYCKITMFSAILLYALLVTIFLSLYPGLIGYFLKRYYSKHSFKVLVFALPAAWVIAEWLRSWLFTGFPWFMLGDSQIDAPLKSFAPLLGVFGVSWLVVLSAALFFITLRKQDYNLRLRIISIGLLVVIWCLGFILNSFSWVKFDNIPHKVSLIQTNMDPKIKPTLTFEEHAKHYSPLTIASLDSELIVWPEHSLPYFLPYSAQYLNEIDSLAKKNNLTILLGVLDSPPELYKNNKLFLYNSVRAVGVGTGNYYKQRLVPFAEYLPYERYLSVILNKLNIRYRIGIKGDKLQDSLHLPSGNLLPVVCYEVAYAEHLRGKLKQTQAHVIVNLSEDGWFGDSNVLQLNIDHARMRALETGRYLLRSATRGITAIINPQGQIIATSRPFVTDAVRGVYFNAYGITPWTRFGISGLLLLMALSISFTINWRSLPKRLWNWGYVPGRSQ